MINAKNNWIIRGLFWGTFMFLAMKVLLPISQGEQLTLKGLLFGLLYWELAGLVFGYILRLINKNDKTAKVESTDSVS